MAIRTQVGWKHGRKNVGFLHLEKNFEIICPLVLQNAPLGLCAAFSFCVTSRIPAVLESLCCIIGRFFCCVLFPNDVLAALICLGKTSFTSAEFAGSVEIHYPSVLCSCTKMFPVKPQLAVI